MFFILVPIFFLFLNFHPVHAASSIQVTPSILQIDLGVEKEAVLYYKNTLPVAVELSFSAQDFTELGEGGLTKLLEKKDTKNYRYSLSSWISFEKQTLLLNPGEEQQVKIFIDEKKLAPGAHYASIQATLSQKDKGKGVLLKSVLASLLFVRTTTGNEIEKGKVLELKPNQQFFAFPNTFVLRFQNSGNVELIPHGLIEVKDPFGNVVAKGIVNENSLITLPESIRRYEVPIIKTERFFFPGIYTAQTTIKYGKSKQTIKKDIKFFSLGSLDLQKILLIAIPLLLILVYWKRK